MNAIRFHLLYFVCVCVGFPVQCIGLLLVVVVIIIIIIIHIIIVLVVPAE